MDLMNYVPQEDTVTITLKYRGETLLNEPEKDNKPMTITVYLPHSKEAKAVEHEIANKQIKQFQKKKSMELDAAKLEEQSLERLAKLTASWEITLGGEQPKLSVEKATEVYRDVPWIKTLVEAEVEEAMDFTQD